MATKNRAATAAAAAALNTGENPRILALDLGQKCGVATFEGGSLRAVMVWNFDSARRASLGTKYLAFRGKLEEAIATAAEDGVPLHFVYEAVDFIGRGKFGSGTYAAHAWGAMEAVLHMTADTHGVPVMGLAVSTIKAVGGGDGKATKEMMRTQARLMWPNFRWGEDEADAAMCGWAYLNGARSQNGNHA